MAHTLRHRLTKTEKVSPPATVNAKKSDVAETGPWKKVAVTVGLLPAQIIADNLIANGFPARAWQESAGQALGLTVGLLGNGYVMVPAHLEQQALDFLDSLDEEE